MKNNDYFTRVEYIDGVPVRFYTRTGGRFHEDIRLEALDIIKYIKIKYNPWLFYSVYYDDAKHGGVTITALDFDTRAHQKDIEPIVSEKDYGQVYFHIEIHTYPKPNLRDCGDNDSYDVYLIETHEKALEERHREYEKEVEENLKLMNQAFCKKYGKLPSPARQKVHAELAYSAPLDAALKEGVALAHQEEVVEKQKGGY